MSLVRGKGNQSTELKLIRLFRENGITGWRRNYPITGNPDFVFPRKRIALFADGCFWHGCTKHGRMPKSNKAFWRRKIAANMKRDRVVTRELRRQGWRVVRQWEHALKESRAIQRMLSLLES